MPQHSLSPRERDVLAVLRQGLTNKEIGRRLDISPRTVEHHRAHILAKLGARSVLDLVRRGPSSWRERAAEARAETVAVTDPQAQATLMAGSPPRLGESDGERAGSGSRWSWARDLLKTFQTSLKMP